MKQDSTIAERLLQVNQAREEFLVRAWIDRFMVGPMLLDRLAADLGMLNLAPNQSYPRPATELHHNGR